MPVLETPFRPDESVDEDGFLRVLAAMRDAGVETVMFPGFASEYHKLSEPERHRLVELLVESSAAGGPSVIVSIADHATRLAVSNARDAAERGACAINLLPPHFLGPSVASVRDHVRAVARAVDPLPVVVQYAPTQTGTALDAASLSALAAENSNVRHVKVESQPPGRLIAALAEQPTPMSSVVGYAGLQMPDAMSRGAVGIQPGCSFVEIYLDIWRQWRDGDEAAATALHRRVLPYLSYWMQHVELIVAAEKAISVARGWFDSATCRRPCWTLDEGERDMVDRFVGEFEPWLQPRASTPIRSDGGR